MINSTAVSPMQYVHEVLTGEFGRMTAALEDDGRVQPVYLPGGERPGLADFLLTTHSRWLFGRFERNEDLLVVEHSVTTDSLTPTAIVRIARTVHDEAVNAERTLQAIGALSDDE